MGCIKTKKIIKVTSPFENNKPNNDKIQNNNIFIHYIGKNINNNISKDFFDKIKKDQNLKLSHSGSQILEIKNLLNNDDQSKSNFSRINSTYSVSNADKDKESDIFKLTNNSLNDHINKELKFEEKYKIINEENYDFYFPSYKIKLNKSESDKEEFFSMIKIEKKIFGSLVNDKKILKEVTLLSEFDSKYLLKTYECFISNKFYYLITEHCSYSRLNEKLRCEIKYTENQICYIIIQILKAIKYLISKNYVHVEISPEKILICDIIKSSYGEELYNIKLLNFFCPSRSNLLFNSKSFYQYIAPEIMNKKYSKNCYIWSLGIIIFQMYFGELSYKYNNDINEYVQIMRTTYKYNEEMSPELKDLLDKMIEINPEYRTNIDECLEHNWINKKDTEIVVGEIDSLK
jgi:hypothetical protein